MRWDFRWLFHRNSIILQAETKTSDDELAIRDVCCCFRGCSIDWGSVHPEHHLALVVGLLLFRCSN